MSRRNLGEVLANHALITLFTTFGLGAGSVFAIYQIIDSRYDMVRKNSYMLNDSVNANYVLKTDYDKIQAQLSIQKDNPEDLSTLLSARKVMVFPHDSIDYFGIKVYSSSFFKDSLVEMRNLLKNYGYQNTEIFLASDSIYSVIVYGYACVGTGLKKNESKIKSILKKYSQQICHVNLTTMSSEGFVEHMDNKAFLYWKPRI